MTATRFADSLRITTGALEEALEGAIAPLGVRPFPEARFAHRPSAWSEDPNELRCDSRR